jgi:uncharacterized membrane protein YqjE
LRDVQTEARERPSGELLKELSDQTTALVRKEIELAKVELSEKGKAAGQGAGMFGGAGIAALFALGCLTACAILALASAMDGWLAALIVGVIYLAIAGVLALVGRGRLSRATPPVPEQAVETTKEDVEWVKQRAKSGRSN